MVKFFNYLMKIELDTSKDATEFDSLDLILAGGELAKKSLKSLI